MEGLLPFLYRAILHYANGGQTPVGNPFFNESPSASPCYVRLAGGADSGRLLFAECLFPFAGQPRRAAPVSDGSPS